MIFDIDGVESKIGYSFKDKMLLRQCFTHASYAHEHNTDDNELLEFFGDSILEFVITEYLCKNHYGDEGDLTKLRSEIVSKEPLQRAVERLGIGEFLIMGVGQVKNFRKDDKMFSSLYEALVAGIYKDGGMTAVKRFIKSTLISDFEMRERRKCQNDIKKVKDGKSLLQEFVQEKKIGSISYQSLSQTGPDHMPEFREAVLLNGQRLSEGKGRSRKEAQKNAAEKALAKLKQGGN